jgi:hypothetical protein
MSEPKKLALLIGVSDYGEGLEPLSAPPKDVEAIKRVLENPELGRFDPANITTLINPDLAEMRERIEDLFTHSSRQDLVLFYFSGHGITDDSNRLYLTTKHTSKDRYRSRSVPASFIQDLSDDTYARRQVIILDCCYSGAFAEGWQRKGDVKVDLERELGKEGRVVLTSSSSTQVSFQQEDAQLSLYTQYFLEGIESGAADTNQDGEVTVRELHDYAKQKVQEVKPKMKPDIILDNEGYDILLSRVKIDAESRFRKLVEQYVDHKRGEIRSHRSQEILDRKAQDLGIAVEQSQAIIDSVLEPTRRRLKHLEDYRKEYEAEVEKQYPLSETVLKDLQEWQQEFLGLEDSDVATIQAEVNAAKERQISEVQEQRERERAEAERQRQEAEQQEQQQREQAEEQERLRQTEQLRQQQAAEEARLKQRELERQQQEQRKQAARSQPLAPPPEATQGDYAQLDALLRAGKWKEADQETAKQMCQVMGRQSEGWLREEDIENFPCADLRAIDQLWVTHSNGKFGFSVQKKIWQQCGSPTGDNRDWEKFGEAVGWRTKGFMGMGAEWKCLFDLTFDTSAPSGHLPRYFLRAYFEGFRALFSRELSSLARRCVNCSI